DLPTFRCPERKLRDGGDLLAVSTLEQARPVVETRARIDADLPACLRAGRERVRDELVELSGDVHAGVRELIVDNQLVIPVTADDRLHATECARCGLPAARVVVGHE